MTCDRPHRFGGWARMGGSMVGEPLRFRRRCRRRACATVETINVTPAQVAALDARIAAQPDKPYAETSGRHLIGRARHTGNIVLIPIGR